MATAIVTLGLHEHYLIDLIVAVPLAVEVHAGTGLLEQKKETWAQLLAALGGAGMTVAWLFIIRYGTASLRNAPEIASALVLATVAVSVWLVYWSETESLRWLSGIAIGSLPRASRPLPPDAGKIAGITVRA